MGGNHGADLGLAAASVVVVGLATWALTGGGVPGNRAAPASPPSVTASLSPPAAAATKPASLNAARTALNRDEPNVLILGDSTGNDPGEWPWIWAQSIGDQRGTWLRGYNTPSGRYVDPIVIEGDRRVKMWVGAIPGATGQTLLDRWDLLWPAETPDLVILNLGQNSPPYGVDPQTTPLLERVRSEAPKAKIVVLLQAPRAADANRLSREAMKEWADRNGLPTIDIAGAWGKAGESTDELLFDGLHPNEQGSRLWAAAVQQALREP